MRDYEAEVILGDDHQRRKTRYQRWREAKISGNEPPFNRHAQLVAVVVADNVAAVPADPAVADPRPAAGGRGRGRRAAPQRRAARGRQAPVPAAIEEDAVVEEPIAIEEPIDIKDSCR